MRRRACASIGRALVAALGALSACASSAENSGSGASEDAGADSSAGPAAAPDAGDSAASGSSGGGSFGDIGDCRACSGDGRAVTNCAGTVVQTCADNQACQKGACVDACTLAQTSSSSQGCDFYSVIPPAGSPSDNSCFAAMVANTWTAPITIRVEYDGQSLDVAAIARTPNFAGGSVTYDPLPGGRLAPGQMAILFLNGGPGQETLGGHVNCPVTAAVTTVASIAGTGNGWAFRIGTTAPVAAYDIYPFGGAKSAITSATLLVPPRSTFGQAPRTPREAAVYPANGVSAIPRTPGLSASSDPASGSLASCPSVRVPRMVVT
jgi:hypothetical protein